MPRPSIVIGVGGTGSWVLSWLKKDLLETHDSIEPLPVRFLLLDTADLIAETGGAQTDSEDEAVGTYSRYLILDQDNEFIQIPTDKEIELTRRINREVVARSPEVDHISSWFAGNYFPDASYALVDGAGQFRQLGRLALVQGLHLNRNSDRVYSKLQNLISQVMERAGNNRNNIDVHIVGSLIGGSGSGIFIDIAWLVRKLVPNNVRLFITGFFALPGAFNMSPTTAQRMKAFAAWRELNRMMTVKEGETEFRVRWGQNDSVIHDVKQPVYDHVYLIDDSLGRSPQETTFPIMAEAISFYLDQESGTEYVQHIRTNLANNKTTYPLRHNPSYSALYVKSWKLPLYHNLSIARHNFARAFLKRLLQIEEEQQINYADRRQTQTVYRLIGDPMYRNRAVEIFNAPMLDTGSTGFIERLAELSQMANTDYQSQVDAYAADEFGMLELFASMPETPEGVAVTNTIAESKDFVIPPIPPTNDTNALHDYVQKTWELLYGPQNRAGKYVEYYGDFISDTFKGKMFSDLDTVQKFTMNVFRRRVQTWVNQELNRISPDGAFSGLACVLDALTQIDEDLGLCVRFFTDVKNKLGSVGEVKGVTSQWWQTAFDNTQNANIIKNLRSRLGVGPKNNVESWYSWEVVNLSRQRSHRATERILSTLREMKDYVANVALANVRAMVQQLVTDNDFDHVSGLYRGLMDSLDDENNRHAFDQRLDQVVVLLRDDSSIPPVDEDKLQELLQRTKWTVDGQMNLRLEIQVSPIPSDPPIVLESNLKDPHQTRRLVNQLVQGVASYVVFDNQRQTAANIMGLPSLQRELTTFSTDDKIMYKKATKTTSADVRTFYVRALVNQSDRTALNTALNNLSLSRQAPNVVTQVSSENRNKIVIFSARELLLPTDFDEWKQAENAYHLMVTGDKSRDIDANFDRVKNDHLFRGEQEALTLEQQYRRVGRIFPTLDQRLVHLLENRPHLDQFLHLWAIGWIVDEKRDIDDVRLMWRLKAPEDYGLNIPLAEKGETDVIGLIARYVAYGRDRHGEALPFRQISRALDDELKRLRRDQASAEQLQAVYQFEASTAIKLAEVVQDRLDYTDNEVNAEMMRSALDKAVATLERPGIYLNEAATRGYRRSLAEEIAYDFTMRRDGEPLVTNINGHLQAMQIVLNLLYQFKAEEIKSIRVNNNWV